ncbi:glycosyltransferase family 2 protein [Agathobaculum sp. NTUH-O15-33]|uniref:glycosyltransferase family 2 protein n=1 Tax=Agathobaculum sp. NTUH-O15-33 TaxID=3079302 RepID=UPI002958B354|nr:glycosyltransferase family 2 protein [Agathobaculum sp. NTUH-O15-33]WNX85163.1 glycosyltransferase family 2 protein [Agathobaculum sp. NTUH-O15-33]
MIYYLSDKKWKIHQSIAMPLISVIIPVYNTARFLGECLDSVLKQNYRNLEILCIDDGSTDSSPSIIEFYGSRDCRVHCYHQSNQGQSVARNFGLMHAKGEYVCFLDSDDRLVFNTFLQCIEVFSRHKVDVVLFNMEMFFPNGKHFKCFDGPLYHTESPIIYSRQQEISVNFTNAAAGLYTKKLLIEKNIRFPEGMIYEDWVFMVSLMSHRIHFFWLNSPLYWYRRDFANSTTSIVTEKCLDLFRAYRLADDILRKAPCGLNQLFINDGKILNESIGFLMTRIKDCQDAELVYQFICEIFKIFIGFPTAYFRLLCNYLSGDREKIANILYGICFKNYNKDETLKIWDKLKVIITKEQKIVACKDWLHNLKNKLRKYCKTVLRSMLPAYRVSSSIREELEQMQYDVCTSKQQIDRLVQTISENAKTRGMENESRKAI